jgi:hypothetical protein
MILRIDMADAIARLEQKENDAFCNRIARLRRMPVSGSQTGKGDDSNIRKTFP